MKRIAFVNEKGGTCKTTLAVNLAAFFARAGRRVLLVDLDTQGHAGKSLGIDARQVRPNVYDWLLDPDLPLEQVAQPTAVAGLDLIPANKALAEFPLAVAYDRERVLRLDRRLDQGQERWDYAFIDAPPSAGLFVTTAILAATDLVVPVATTYLALDGCAEIERTVGELHRAYDRVHPRISLVVPTLYRRTAIGNEVIRKLRAHFPETVSQTVLSQSVHLDECQSYGESIFEYAPRSKGAAMMRAIGDELFARVEAATKSVPRVVVPSASSEKRLDA